MSRDDARLFLKTLKEDGIEHVHLTKKGQAADSSSPFRKGGERGISVEKSPLAPLYKRGEQPEKQTSVPAAPLPKNPNIESLREEVLGCKKCAELARTRTTVVFGSGSTRAKLVFVGEAPGADEDLQGLPFVGRAGQLLTKIITAMGMTRDQVFICNVLKCRPPNNRPPAPGEVAHCRPYLKRQLELIRPQVIVALGNHAVKALLGTEQGISALRGTFQKYEGIPVMCTYHPAYLLRSPGEKRKVWEDMKQVMKFLNSSEG